MSDTANSMQIPEYVKRELSEVYLLMDHIAGRQDESLDAALATPVGSNISTTLDELCQIPWPPSSPDRAAQLSLVLTAKDRLSRAAYPATGLSIAFTYLSTSATDGWFIRRLTKKQLLGNELSSRREATTDLNPPGGGDAERVATSTEARRRSPAEATIVQFALDAFPGLDSKQQNLTYTFRILVLILVVLLSLTCYATWNLSIGQRLLSDYAASTIVAVQASLAPPKAGTADQSATANGEKGSSGSAPAASSAGAAVPGKPSDAQTSSNSNFLSIVMQNATPASIIVRMQAWNCHQWPLTLLLTVCATNTPGQPPASDWELTNILVSILNYNVLPVILGALASVAAALRDIAIKVEDNELVPRDLKLVWPRIFLGAFLGAVIGLLVTPSTSAVTMPLIAGSSTSGATSATGANLASAAIALTPATLSFLAGFATDRIFSWLDNLIDRIFGVESVKK